MGVAITGAGRQRDARRMRLRIRWKAERRMREIGGRHVFFVLSHFLSACLRPPKHQAR
jgi:hypothetical protein